jgi:hypothetical protein
LAEGASFDAYKGNRYGVGGGCPQLRLEPVRPARALDEAGVLAAVEARQLMNNIENA